MQIRGSRASARQHKAVEWREFGVEAVDLIFKPRDLFFRDAQGAGFACSRLRRRWRRRICFLRTTQISAHVEQIILNVLQDFQNLSLAHVKVCDTDG